MDDHITTKLNVSGLVTDSLIKIQNRIYGDDPFLNRQPAFRSGFQTYRSFHNIFTGPQGFGLKGLSSQRPAKNRKTLLSKHFLHTVSQKVALLYHQER